MEFRKLKAEEIDCRISQIDKTWCTLLLYKDARVDQNILDETVGAMNWQKRYVRDNHFRMMLTITIDLTSGEKHKKKIKT